MRSGKAAAQKMIRESDDKFLICRVLLHQFDERTSRVETTGSHYRWGMKCARCGVVREKVLDRHGRILGTTYKYPKGYQSPGVGRLDSAGMGHLRFHVMAEVLSGGFV